MNKLEKIIYIVAIFCFISCGNAGEKQDATPNYRPVKYMQVGNASLEGKHNYTGLAKAQQKAKLSFKVGGTINSIPVKVGDVVKKGQTIATIDATDYRVSYTQSLANEQSSEAQIGSAQAQLESAKAAMKTAKSNYGRFEKLYETNSISLSDFEQSKSSYLSAEASYKAALQQVEAAKANAQSSKSMVNSASNQVNYTTMKAPFEGVISSIMVEPNEVVGQGSPVIELNSNSNPDVEIGVPENAIAEIESNQRVEVVFNSLHHHTFEGVVHEIGYSSVGSTYPVTIRLKEGDERIRPGMPASATFYFDDHHSNAAALLVPPGAVGEDGDGNFIYKLTPKDKFFECNKERVKVGRLTDAGFEVISGVANGDKIASSGLNVLRDGMMVSLYQKN